MIITKPINDVNDLLFTLSLPTGRVWADIEDVAFIVKEDIDDALADSKIEKYKSDGDIVLENGDTVKVKFTLQDYTGLVIGYAYVGGLFCKFVGQSDFDESIDTFDFKIKKSMHNQIV